MQLRRIAHFHYLRDGRTQLRLAALKLGQNGFAVTPASGVTKMVAWRKSGLIRTSVTVMLCFANAAS